MLNIRIITYTFVFSVLFTNISISQQLNKKYDIEKFQQKSSIIKTNPLPIIHGPIIYTAEYRLVYEKAIAPEQAILIGGSYLGKSIYLTMLEENDTAYQNATGHLKMTVNGFRFQFAYKLYFAKNAPKGFYIAPYFSYSQARFSTKYLKQYDDYIKATFMNYDIIVGYQALITDKIALDIFSGLGYRENTWVEHFSQTTTPMDEPPPPIYNGWLKIILGCNIGYAF